MSKWTAFGRLFRGWFEGALQAGRDVCLACRAPLADAEGPAINRCLCRRCRETVPWIRPGDIRCATCGRPEVCPDCPRRTDTAFVCNRSAVRYTREMKDWLSRLKFRGDERLAAMFAFMMGGALERLMEEQGLHRRAITCLTWVPLSEDRLAERGFNQTELIVRKLASDYRIPALPLLARTRDTGKMSQKSRAERLRHLEGAFICPEGSAPFPTGSRFRSGRPLRIVLVDDVYTTGSTMQECASAIRRSYPEADIYGLTWAR